MIKNIARIFTHRASKNTPIIALANSYFRHKEKDNDKDNGRMNQKILADAIAHPEKYQHIMWYQQHTGTTEKFCDIPLKKQLEIIDIISGSQRYSNGR